MNHSKHTSHESADELASDAGADDEWPTDVGRPLNLLFGASDLQILKAYFQRITIAAGVTVIERGQQDRNLYVVLAGRAGRVRDGVEIGVVQAGDHFGDLALTPGHARAAAIVAHYRLDLLRLSHERYSQLTVAHPQVAIRLLQNLVGAMATQLEAMTDTVGLLLGERSHPRHTQVRAQVGADWISVQCGATVGTVLPALIDGKPVVAALVNNRITGLGSPITSQCHIAPVTVDQPEGQSVWRHSLCMLILEAAWRLDPNLRISMGYSVGYGRRIDVLDPIPSDLNVLGRRLETKALDLVTAGLRGREEWWTVEEATDHFGERGWQAARDLLRTWYGQRVPLCSYGQVNALALGPLVDDTRLLGGFRIHADADGLLLQFPRALISGVTGEAAQAQTRGHDKEMRQISRLTVDMTHPQEKWLAALGIKSVGAFNDACIKGDVGKMIRVSEGFQERGIIDIANRIAHPPGDLRRPRIVTIAGPSSSGKTTFIQRLNVQLQVCGLRPIGLSLDNYYVDRTQTPRDAQGEYDFEAIEALRLDLLHSHVMRLLAGQPTATARYDFHGGNSLDTGGPTLTLDSDSVLLMEGIHGLNPRLLDDVDKTDVFSIFVCPLAQLPFDRLSRVRASDVRLIRRIVRDRHGRNHNAMATIMRWSSVRNGERKHIMPYQHLASAVFDSSLLYELSVLKVYAQRYLLEVPQDHEAFATASRLLGLLDRFVTIYPDHVPPTSILREFIGASVFEY